MVRRVLTTLLAALIGASVLAIVPVGFPDASGEGEPTLTISVTEGLTGTSIQATGTGCFLPDGTPAGTYAVKGTCIAPMYEDLGVVTAEPFTVTGAGAPVPEREPATPRFPNQIEPYPTYDGQSTCSPAAKPGMIAYRDMVM